ncbi:hypothetical protein [Zavarzinella formosa]|uniref:hypothetical protein n=1 Tax=Zavarzinella formosa TaxID=360055 RepID=UPI00031D82FD|nr:hypothetical protein [Zavarzinella formosa]
MTATNNGKPHTAAKPETQAKPAAQQIKKPRKLTPKTNSIGPPHTPGEPIVIRDGITYNQMTRFFERLEKLLLMDWHCVNVIGKEQGIFLACQRENRPGFAVQVWAVGGMHQRQTIYDMSDRSAFPAAKSGVRPLWVDYLLNPEHDDNTAFEPDYPMDNPDDGF